jgi:hypothetical protein
MSDSTEQQRQLKIQKGIRQVEDEIVIAIQTALDDKSSYGDLEESQFRNLVRVSDTTESTEVIKNFLRYQVGRDKKWGRGDNSLASRIISDIDQTISNLALKISQASEALQQKNDVHIKLTRLYLGYGARYLKYLRDGKTTATRN